MVGAAHVYRLREVATWAEGSLGILEASGLIAYIRSQRA
jgi:hypothetical protein